MPLPIHALTTARLSFLTHAERLQAAGHLSGSPLDFRAIRDQSIQAGLAFIRDFHGQSAPGEALPLGQHELDRRVQVILREARGVAPRTAPDFHPLEFLLPDSTGRDLPVIVEKVEVDEALREVPPEHRGELRPFERLRELDGTHPFVFLFRGWEGMIYGLCVVALHEEDAETTMLCCRDLKLKRGEEASVQQLGVAMVMSRLIYMKQQGHWPAGLPVLTDIKPPVLQRYREYFRVPRHSNLVWDDWSICSREADLMLNAPPTSFVAA